MRWFATGPFVTESIGDFVTDSVSDFVTDFVTRYFNDASKALKLEVAPAIAQ